jgi:type IV pilus assembly protein PilM
MQLKLSRKPSADGEEQVEAAPASASAESVVEKLNQRANLSGLTGLDISSSQIAAATVSGNRVKTASYMALDPGLVVDGEIADPDALGVAIAEFIAASGMSDRVRIGVASSRVVIRSFEMPVIEDRKEFEAAVRFQASEHLPMSVDEAVIDYTIVGTIPPKEAGEQEKLQVLLVGASRGLIDGIVATAHKAGVKLQSIDLSAFGLIRTLYPGAASAQGTVCYLHVGDMVNVTLAEGTVCKFTRSTPSGLAAATQRLMDSAGLTREHAQMWIDHVGLLQPVEAIQGEADIVAAAREELMNMVNQLGNDITASVDFHNVQPGATRVSSIVLVGPGSKLDGIADALAQRSGLPVTVAAPLGALDASDVDTPEVDLTRMTMAVGLALEEAVAA